MSSILPRSDISVNKMSLELQIIPVTPVKEIPVEIETQSEIHAVNPSAMVYKSAFDNEVQDASSDELALSSR
jgi:hypothetical protein